MRKKLLAMGTMIMAAIMMMIPTGFYGCWTFHSIDRN